MTAKRLRTSPIVQELFSGAGFLSHSFAVEGFQIVGAVEIDSIAGATYRRNVGDHVMINDVRAIAPRGRCDVLCCGSPCQSYSTLGKKDPNDPRHLLSLEVVKWAKKLMPRTIVIENVPAFLDAPVWRLLARRLRRLGYQVEPIVLNALDFGAPQQRVRSFTLAFKGRMPSVKVSTKSPKRTVRQAWEGLPAKPNGINHHYAPFPSDLALARMQVIPPGGDKRDVMRNAPHLAAPSWWNLRSEITDVWGRMDWDEPSNTIRTCLLNPSKGRYIHPDQDRVISLREAARLQTVPDSWVFCGLPTQIARQIGNGVPIVLGRAVARAVYEAL
ncbi:MAG TPA: DNA cytosine methyltransferase [Pyrinomonadaceae bacterium]|nr:DNA cytosine methyltransferase [Pyrinomonadaceae bacterium]